MKQNFFMLLAVMLLSSASAFAQSGNNESLMGDVNGDGRVDIVDVTTVIDIYLNTAPDTGDSITYYFSVGTTPIDENNYTTANNATTTIPTSTTFSTTVRGYGYILAPSNKTISVVDADDNAPGNFTEQTSISIPNHKVYKTAVLNVGGTIKITLL